MASSFIKVICGGYAVEDPSDVQTQPNLFRAAERGDSSLVRELLRTCTNIDVVNKFGSSPLLIAALNGHLEVVDILIKKGANVNHRGPDLWTPLHAACFYGHMEVACLLLGYGADPNAINLGGDTPGVVFDTTVPTGISATIRVLLKDYAGGNLPIHRSSSREKLGGLSAVSICCSIETNVQTRLQISSNAGDTECLLAPCSSSEIANNENIIYSEQNAPTITLSNEKIETDLKSEQISTHEQDPLHITLKEEPCIAENALEHAQTSLSPTHQNAQIIKSSHEQIETDPSSKITPNNNQDPIYITSREEVCFEENVVCATQPAFSETISKPSDLSSHTRERNQETIPSHSAQSPCCICFCCPCKIIFRPNGIIDIPK